MPSSVKSNNSVTLSVVIPCYNEEATLNECVQKVKAIQDDTLKLEIIIVDDASKDNCLAIAQDLARQHPEVKVLQHDVNQGKGAALRTGFACATGQFVVVQDADLEYNPMDLKKLLKLLRSDEADVVLGSRFLSPGAHRVLYFWHSIGNKFLTFMSNMFTDLNLTDMETCYKMFKREVIQHITIKENRFGFEPEIVAKIAQMRLRIFEVGISYHGRTYAEGKKIGAKDGIRALYCIFRYNANKAPLPIQFALYLLIGGTSAIFNLFVFLFLLSAGLGVNISAGTAFVFAAILNYLLCITLLFRHRARWDSVTELGMYWLVVGAICVIDLAMTRSLLSLGFSAWMSKISASIVGLMFNFIGRKFLIFPEPASGPWAPQVKVKKKV